MPIMRWAIHALCIGFVTALVGCGSKRPVTVPAACAQPASAYLNALRAAPRPVRLADGAAISDCFTGAEGAAVAQPVIKAASTLNARARDEPGGQATVELGYLAGAIHQGTAHVPSDADLVRRIDQAARYNPRGGSLGAAFERAFGKGYAAGEATG